MVWEEDLEFGKYFERHAIKQKNIKNVERRDDKLYDFKDVDTGIKYEVKVDRLTSKTGNICIEFECSFKPSGINSTKANYYIYYVYDEEKHKYGYYEIPVKKIKKYINQGKHFKSICGGDNKKSYSYLFKTDVLEKYLVKDWK